jgi:hypothetical protein
LKLSLERSVGHRLGQLGYETITTAPGGQFTPSEPAAPNSIGNSIAFPGLSRYTNNRI